MCASKRKGEIYEKTEKENGKQRKLRNSKQWEKEKRMDQKEERKNNRETILERE